jgi:hypothetical protein
MKLAQSENILCNVIKDLNLYCRKSDNQKWQNIYKSIFGLASFASNAKFETALNPCVELVSKTSDLHLVISI